MQNEKGEMQSVGRRSTGWCSPFFIFHFSFFIVHSAIPRGGAYHRRTPKGLTLIEAAISTFLVGVLLVAALRTVGASVFTQQRAFERTTGQMLAEGLLTEILAKGYREPNTSSGFGRETGESTTSKANYDDVDDFHDWSESPPQFADGSAMPDLAGWQRSVEVEWVNPTDLGQTVWWDTGAKRVTVSVQRSGNVIASRVAIRGDAP